ncbi:hypothetical protein MTR_6g086820 [Medicago truncatula]|uniref:Uncharacterized protein n=1 Tax=Medicago truncatula TaxID=3880 RepID=A0A072UMN3_MEDTR|nr:hypothetical protein MTR_6g086820 [Medicago truncatula]
MSNQKEAKVADVWVTMEVGREYRFECRRRFFVFEEELLNNMMEVLHGHVWTEGVDKWVWRMVGVLREPFRGDGGGRREGLRANLEKSGSIQSRSFLLEGPSLTESQPELILPVGTSYRRMLR